jgi:fibronectin type 3 domain-containing protein
LTLQVQFKPTVVGSASGQLTINSNSSSGSTTALALSGTGTSVAHQVNLTWNAPGSSPDPVAGYNIYRSTGSGSYQLMNSSPDVQTAYANSTAVTGATYNYTVKSVDSSGIESASSNQITVTIP